MAEDQGRAAACLDGADVEEVIDHEGVAGGEEAGYADALFELMAEADAERPAPPSAEHGTRTVGELAHRLQVTPATLRNWENAGILCPARDPLTGYRVYRAADIRDAELAHLLRRGGYPLDHIATVVRQIRTAGGTDTLSDALDDWRRRLTARGVAMLDAAARLGAYLGLLDRGP